MRKLLRLGLLCSALSALLCVAAMAETGTGYYDVSAAEGLPSGVSVTVTPDQNTATSAEFNGGTHTLYRGSEKLTVSVTDASAAEDSQYLVILTSADSLGGVNAGNIYYINQAGKGQDFTVYPDVSKLASTGQARTLNLFVTSSSSSFGRAQASVGYANGVSYTVPRYIAGDANGDGTVDISDALAVVQHVVGNAKLTGNNLLAAKVTENDEAVSVSDALRIVQFVVGNISSF